MALGAPAAGVPGTGWRLESTDWTSEELEVVHALAVALPPVYRDLEVRLHREAHGELSSDAPLHLRRRIGGVEARIHLPALALDGGGSREPSAGVLYAEARLDAAERWRRALVHSLTEVADSRQGWSDAWAWRSLSEWSDYPLRRAGERDLLSYAEPRGTDSPAEDLATLAEHYFQTRRLPTDAPAHAACRLRSKWHYFEELVEVASPVPVRCPSLADVGMDPDEIDAIDLIYAQASTRSPQSLAGHLGIALVYAAREGSAPRTRVFNIGADTGDQPPGSPAYIFRGITGGFQAVVTAEPLSRVILRYQAEHRSVQRLRLDLTEEQKHRLLERLDDLRQGWDRSYLFFSRNCTHFPQMLIEWALEEDFGLPRIYGPDVLLATLDRRGLLEHVGTERLESFSTYDRGRTALSLRTRAVGTLASTSPPGNGALTGALGLATDRRPAERARGYRELSDMMAGTGSSDLLAETTRFLVWSEQWESARYARSRHGVPDEVQDALWSSLDTLNPSTEGTAQAELVVQAVTELTDALEEDVHREHNDDSGHPPHTPLRPRSLTGGSILIGDLWLPVLEERSALYHAQLGEHRRYATARGLDVVLLDHHLTIALDEQSRPSIGGAFTTLRVQRVMTSRPLLNAGWYADTFDGVRRAVGDELPEWWDMLTLGALVELGQLDQHRVHAGIAMGVGGGWQGRGSWLVAPEQWAFQATTPIRAFGRLGARKPMTHLSLEGEWRRPMAREVPSVLTVDVGSQLGLGEWWGAGIALRLAARSTTLAPAREPSSLLDPRGPASQHQLTLGLAMERF